jgi:uncharacterized membrane-anchored protein YhcB (DUF1043 family)
MTAAMDTAIAVGLITAGSTLVVGVTTGYISFRIQNNQIKYQIINARSERAEKRDI